MSHSPSSVEPDFVDSVVSEKHVEPVFLGEGGVGESGQLGRRVRLEEGVEEQKGPALRLLGEEPLEKGEDAVGGPARETLSIRYCILYIVLY